MHLIFALLVAAGLPAIATANHAADHAAGRPAAAAAPLTDGTVKKVDAAAGEIVIQHGALDSIGMPPMTMAFGVADKRWLDKLKAGDKIRFAAEMKGSQPVVSRYEAAK